MITFKEYLAETPLPDDWDKTQFTTKVSYAKQIKYAVERAQKIGKGSSRTAFVIPYKGRDTILKVAHNAKGRAQNEAESEILSDNYAKTLGICIPIIDYDETSDQPTWIHTEKADKISEAQLCKLLRTPSLKVLVGVANNRIDGKFKSATELFIKQMKEYNKNNETDIEIFYNYIDKLVDLSKSFDIQLVDFETKNNWGIYKGKPVVIDVGFNSVTSTLYQQQKLF